MNDTPQPVDPALITYLKRLVTALAGTMILGFVALIVLFVIRFSGSAIAIPDELALPAGTTVAAYTQGNGWAAVVTTDDRIFVFDATSGAMLKEIQLTAQ